MVDRADNAELLQRAASGDEAALEKLLVAGHAQLATSLARKLPQRVRPFVSVDDVLQDVYVTVFREIHSFQPRGEHAFRKWISRIAENRLFDVIRAETAAKRGGDQKKVTAPHSPQSGTVVEWLEHLAVHERTPSRSAAGREALAAVREALAGLKQDYQEALQLRYMEGLSVADTARRMQRSEGAVCLLCHRALRQLHVALGASSEVLPLSE